MNDGDSIEYGLVFSFSDLPFGETTEHAFVHGVELGQLWQRMRSGSEAEIEGTFHAINRTAIERCAAADGWEVEFKDATDESGASYNEWLFAALKKVAVAPPNPHGLRVVR